MANVKLFQGSRVRVRGGMPSILFGGRCAQLLAFLLGFARVQHVVIEAVAAIVAVFAKIKQNRFPLRVWQKSLAPSMKDVSRLEESGGGRNHVS